MSVAKQKRRRAVVVIEPKPLPFHRAAAPLLTRLRRAAGDQRALQILAGAALAAEHLHKLRC